MKGSIFYFDCRLKEFEAAYDWDGGLAYLEEVYLRDKLASQVCSLIGFSWYYLIEGPFDSGTYNPDMCKSGLHIWGKYLNLGFEQLSENPYFNFIAGYTLLLHGFYIDAVLKKTGANLIEKCQKLAAPSLRAIADCILKNERAKNSNPLKNSRQICEELFGGGCLLDKYFFELFTRHTNPQ